jgi:hypothetical protein
MPSRRTALGAAVLVVLIVLAVAVVRKRDGGPTRVALFGDSLTAQAQPYVTKMFAASPRYDARVLSLAGTAICDWFGNISRVRDSFHPQVVAFQFVGNDIFKCMRNPDGSKLSNAAYLARWERDTRHAIALFGPTVKIVLIGPPAMETPDDRVYNIFRRLPKQYPNVSFVDGDPMVSPHRRFVKTLPCLEGEPCTGPVVGNLRTNVVRAADGVHFCPVVAAPGQPCAVYASGAYRFAITEFTGITGERPPRTGP